MRKNKKILNIIAALLVVLVLLCIMTRSEGFITAKQAAQNAAREAAQKQETEARRLAINAQNDAKWARERAAGQKMMKARDAAQKQETEARRLAINAQNDAKWARERAAGQKMMKARDAARYAALKKEFEIRDLAIKEKDAEIMRENQERINLRNAAKEYAKSTVNATIKGKPHRWTKDEGHEALKLYYDYINQHSKH